MHPYARLLTISFVVITTLTWGQTAPTAMEIVEQSVTFHDPTGAWETYQAVLPIRETRPNGTDRVRTVIIDRPASRVSITTDLDTLTYTTGIEAGNPFVSVNGIAGATEAEVRALNLTPNIIERSRNYYLYLYGLPMKLLTDPTGTILPKARRVVFQGREYWQVDVTYAAEVREHDWRFFFDPETFALKAYQFWRKSPTDDGEYILLEDLETIGGIRLPKTRHWYNNVDQKNIATDILLSQTDKE